MKNSDKISSVQKPIRRIDQYFDKYAESHQNSINKLIHWICVPLILFSLLGLVWSIPFPHLEFLGRYYGYVNWFSVLFAVVMYYYYKLSPVLTYAMILVTFAFAALIVTIEKMEKEGGLPLWQICLSIFVLSWIGQFIGHKIEGKKPSFFDDLKFLLIGPLWLLHFIFKKAALPY